MRFGELGYAREARASYQDFVAARGRGEVPKGSGSRSCRPTPFAVVSSVVVKDALAAVEAAYERAMIAEVAALCRHIPHADLCIQWDVCNEMSDLGRANFGRGAARRRAARGAARSLAADFGLVPDDAELGLHLCYGDFAGHHFVEPVDAAKMVEFANALVSAIAHSSPTSTCRCRRTHGRCIPSAVRRSPAAEGHRTLSRGRPCQGWPRRRPGADRGCQALCADFGIATECGMARARSQDTVLSLLKTHAAVCAGEEA